MSQRKRLSASQNKAANQRSKAESDDEEDAFTQPSLSQVQRAKESFTPIQIDRKVAEVVQFILIKDQRKVPIRRADIAKHVIKEYRAIHQDIMKRVIHTFDQVFGLKLVEIDPKSHLYILVNKLEALPEEPVSLIPANPKHGLLFTILSVIFMKGGVVKEALVWGFLKKLRVDPGERHDIFGDVKKLVTDEFVRQKYLEYVRIPHTEPMEFELRWGVRADKEINKMKLLEIVGKLFDQEPSSWTQQYREATAAGSQSQSQR
ncbi:hypothetical protein ACEWY4_000803 [Coilia grayii]|uniref:MAGE domain-containing protein n=1 Tax=Coilia grayii TaxID=363190 RepID=A0ABD1KXR0_9TELE